jgi:choline dehydrogenase-like flavoprotein
VVICGGGAGGCMAARELARAGLDVVLLEAGDDQLPHTFTQREDEMLPRMFVRAGGQRTHDRSMLVLSGHGLGGATNHNINLCKRAPAPILERWQAELGVGEGMTPYFEMVERDLGVRAITEAQMNAHNRLFSEGVERLGYRGGMLSHNRDERCVGSGFCELGCAFDAKLNARRVLVPQAIEAGARVTTDARVERVLLEGDRAIGAVATLLDADGEPSGSMTVRARAVCLAGSAIGSAMLALRSSLPDPHGRIGRGLHLHPGAVVAGVFDREIEAWRGIPQSYECTELLDFAPGKDRRAWIVPSFAHPAATAALMPGFGPSLMRRMREYRHIAALAVMVHDETEGGVSAEGSRARIEYVPSHGDREQLARGARAAARILLAAGAREVVVPAIPPLTIRRERDLRAIHAGRFGPHDAELSAVHPMGTLAMGQDPRRSVTDPRGAFHAVRGLWAVDGSLFPTSIGVPPQISIYTFAARVASHVRHGLR